MKTRSLLRTCFVAAMLGMVVGACWAAPLLPVTTVGDWDNGSHMPGSPGTGNAPDINGLGRVDYPYRIGVTEVTNDQYAQLLNDVAKTADPYGLYNTSMSSDPHGGIFRAGTGTSANPWSYTPKSGLENHPVTFVSWYDAVRFCNYRSNQVNLTGGIPWAATNPTPTEYAGPGTGTPGGYVITNGGKDSGIVQVPAPGTRLIYADPKGQGGPNAPDPAYYLLPTENEWYKAAYYKGGSLNAGYWDYPTRSNVAPKSELPPGSNPNGSANLTVPGAPLAVKFTTPVGAYVYKPSTSAYGTYDQAGNVWEWDEQPYLFGTARGMRGGSYNNWSLAAKASWVGGAGIASFNYSDVGFRVILVPEPASLAMLLGCVVWGLIWWLRRK